MPFRGTPTLAVGSVWFKLISAITALLIVASPPLCLSLIKAERDADSAAFTQQQLHAEFDDLVGYGGLIHNFKNWVLRPDEVTYRDAARAQADRALAVLSQLEATVPQAPVAIGDAYDTIGDYQAAIEEVSRLHQAGVPIAEIDQAVRIDDTAALASIDALEASIAESIQDKINDRQNERQLLVAYFAVIVAGLVAVLTARQRDHRRQAEAARYTADMEAFTRIAAHDLKGPLNQMSNLVDFIREDIDENGVVEDLEYQLERIDDRISRLNGRIVGVFEYLRAGTSNEPMAPIDLDALVDDISSTLAGEDVTVAVNRPLGIVNGRQAELEAVVANLISNAIKHHPSQSPSIAISVTRQQRRVSLHVADDGPGIAPDQHEAVFDMYGTLDKIGDGRSGVGLAMVKRIVNGWSGTITIGEVLPHGADFIVSLPES